MCSFKADGKIASLICESVQVDDTPVPRKMARLYLISDILHNSVGTCSNRLLTVEASPLPNVWKYRQAFERQLPAIVSHFADVHDRLLAYRGTITADIFRQQVEAVLTIWERWYVSHIDLANSRIVFTADVHEILQKLLHREATLESFLSGEYKKVETEAVPEEQPVFKSAGFKSSFKRVADTTTVPDHPPQDIAVGDEKEPSSDAVGDATVTLDIDGDPVEDTADVDGEAFDDIDGEAIDDIDGEAM